MLVCLRDCVWQRMLGLCVCLCACVCECKRVWGQYYDCACVCDYECVQELKS